MREIIRPAPDAAARQAALSAKVHEQVLDLLMPVRLDLATIAEAVAEDFGLSLQDAARLIRPFGSHRLGVARAVTIHIALALLPISRQTLSHLFGSSERMMYRCQVKYLARLKTDPEFLARVERLRLKLDEELTSPRPRRPKPWREK